MVCYAGNADQATELTHVDCSAVHLEEGEGWGCFGMGGVALGEV